MKLRKRFSITGAMLCNAIAFFVAHFADSNGNHFLVSLGCNSIENESYYVQEDAFTFDLCFVLRTHH